MLAAGSARRRARALLAEAPTTFCCATCVLGPQVMVFRVRPYDGTTAGQQPSTNKLVMRGRCAPLHLATRVSGMRARPLAASMRCRTQACCRACGRPSSQACAPGPACQPNLTELTLYQQSLTQCPCVPCTLRSVESDANASAAAPERPLVGRDIEVGFILTRATNMVSGHATGGAIVIEGNTGARCTRVCVCSARRRVCVAAALRAPHVRPAALLVPYVRPAARACTQAWARPSC